MITKLRIENYRSFVDAEVTLKPLSLVVGANGSGKSNLLRFLQLLSGKIKVARTHTSQGIKTTPICLEANWDRHANHPTGKYGCSLEIDGNLVKFDGRDDDAGLNTDDFDRFPLAGKDLPIFNLKPDQISGIETVVANPHVAADGSGTAQVLDSLKNGNREDLFDRIEENFKRYVPEISKLSLRTVEKGKKQIQVSENGLTTAMPASELSEGTRLILAILTILHQEKPPNVILLEDIDRGMHPRVFEYVAPLMRDIAERHGINILATTHNPYLVDCFQDDKGAVILVEKHNGASTLSTLESRLEGLNYDEVDPDDMPLGNLWFSGLVGGTPGRIDLRPKH